MRGRENNPAKPVWPKQSDSNKVWRALNNIKIHGQKGTAVLHENGINISLKSQKSIIAKITGAPTAGVYPVSFYANGKNAEATATGTVEVLNLAVAETLPSGTWIIASASAVTYTGEA